MKLYPCEGLKGNMIFVLCCNIYFPVFSAALLLKISKISSGMDIFISIPLNVSDLFVDVSPVSSSPTYLRSSNPIHHTTTSPMFVVCEGDVL